MKNNKKPKHMILNTLIIISLIITIKSFLSMDTCSGFLCQMDGFSLGSIGIVITFILIIIRAIFQIIDNKSKKK